MKLYSFGRVVIQDIENEVKINSVCLLFYSLIENINFECLVNMSISFPYVYYENCL